MLSLLLPQLDTKTLICIIITIIVIYFYLNTRKRQNYWKRKGINYIKPKFLIGNMSLPGSKSFAQQIQEMYNAFPDKRYHGIYGFNIPTLVIKDPDLIKQITIKDFGHFMNHAIFSNAQDPFWGKTLIGSRDERWRDLRSTLSPAFTGSKMKMMYGLMEECALAFADFFKKQNQEVVELEMKETLEKYSCDVIASTAFGLKCNSLENDNEFYVVGQKVMNFSFLRILRFFSYSISPTLAQFFKVRVIPRQYTDYFSKILEDTVKTRRQKNIIRPDLINLFLQSNKEISAQEISSNCFLFFMAGFESVSSLLSFAFYELASNPCIQDRLRAEVRSVPHLTYDSLQKLKYLDMVINETLRKWPTIALFDREVSKDFVIQPVKPEEKPLRLDKGLFVWIPIHGIHHDPKFYPNPEKFDPERFSEENEHKINPMTFLPFGAGPRSCVGARFAVLESKLMVCHVLKNFQVVKIRKTPDPVVLSKHNVTLSVDGGMWLGLKRFK